MSDLREQMRRAREAWFTHDSREFLLRRPTVEQLRAWREDSWSEMLARCVVDWRGVRLSDLLPGGPDSAVEFDADALAEWISDDPVTLGALASEMQRLIAAHAERKESAEKN
jgi:hypothetical protein